MPILLRNKYVCNVTSLAKLYLIELGTSVLNKLVLSSINLVVQVGSLPNRVTSLQSPLDLSQNKLGENVGVAVGGAVGGAVGEVVGGVVGGAVEGAVRQSVERAVEGVVKGVVGGAVGQSVG